MKSFIIRFICLLAVSSMLQACTKDFKKVNTDPNRIDRISPGTLLNPILYEVSAFNMDKSDDITFNLMQVALPFPSASGGVHRYDLSESAGNTTWNTYYRWLTNVKEMQKAALEAGDANYQAIALTLKAWIYSLLTDSFGDVPMVEASRGDEGILHPAFNTQQEVYTQLLADLDSANKMYVASKAMVYGTEILYNNSIDKWRRFTNSLHMRLLMRLSNRTEMNALSKLQAMVDAPMQYPVFTSNDQSAIVKITGITPNVSPWGRAIDFTTFRAVSKFFLDNLNALNDPRRARFATQARTKDGTATIGYKGIPSGYDGSDSQFDYLPSNLNIALVTAPMINVIMSYAEVEFIKAELAFRQAQDVTAKIAYEKGVKAAIAMWGADVPTDYFANEYAAYDNTLARIMLQKYYALFFTDYQQWFEYRRTGLPVLPVSSGMLNDGKMPVRFKYPTTVQSNNTANYNKAKASMGGDDMNTKVWWEK